MPSSDSPPRSGSLATITTPEVSGLPRLDAAVAVVTGGTRGIGLHTAVGLAALGADVITTGRDRNQGELAVRRIAATVPGAAVRYVPTDLSTLAGIRTAGALLLEAATRIDVLVHNAGVLLTSPVRTTDGFDPTVMVITSHRSC